MQVSKITFSEQEMEAILHPDFFYTKHAALKKVMELLSETERTLREKIAHYPSLSRYTNTESPKIFRGENYKLLPYMVLDYPRRFSSESIFAFRSMFWWGKEFSFTLHLQHEALRQLKASLTQHITELAGQDFYFCVNSTPWEYHFEADNYLALDKLIEEEKLNRYLDDASFIKFSRKIPVKNFPEVPEYAAATFEKLMGVLKTG